MQRISAYILAFNEAEKIADAVSSVLWADEIVVADSGSTDRTAEIAQSLGARVVQLPFYGFGDLRNRAIAECRHEWIFSLDSDERCTTEVRDEILAVLSTAPAHDAYLVPRRNYMMGRWIKGSGWYPNFRQPQLFRKGAMRYDDDPVHEGYELLTQRPLGRLQGAISQLPFRNREELINKMNRYSSHGARKLPGKLARRGRWPRVVCQARAVTQRDRLRLGGVRRRVGNFRRPVLPPRQALRGNDSLVRPAERAPTATLRFAGDIRGRCRRCGGARARDVSQG